MFKLSYGLILSGICFSTLASAQDVHSLEDIDNCIQTFVAENLESQFHGNNDVKAHIGHLDPRIRLPLCETELKSEIETGHVHQQNFTVKVSCEQPSKWSIRVPVKMQHFKSIVVAIDSLVKGQVIEASDLNMVKQDINQIVDGYFTSTDKVIGLEVVRNISAGNVVKKHMLKEPTVVRRGETVRMIVQAPGFSIEGSGTAQTDGAKGQTIRVKNNRSNKIVEAVVQEAGVAVIPM